MKRSLPFVVQRSNQASLVDLWQDYLAASPVPISFGTAESPFFLLHLHSHNLQSLCIFCCILTVQFAICKDTFLTDAYDV